MAPDLVDGLKSLIFNCRLFPWQPLKILRASSGAGIECDLVYGAFVLFAKRTSHFLHQLGLMFARSRAVARFGSINPHNSHTLVLEDYLHKPAPICAVLLFPACLTIGRTNCTLTLFL